MLEGFAPLNTRKFAVQSEKQKSSKLNARGSFDGVGVELFCAVHYERTDDVDDSRKYVREEIKVRNGLKEVIFLLFLVFVWKRKTGKFVLLSVKRERKEEKLIESCA